MARVISGEATGEERAVFEGFLQRNEGFQQDYDVLLRVWHHKEKHTENFNDAPADEDAVMLLKKAQEIEGRYKSHHRSVKLRRLLAVAASVALVVLAIVWWTMPPQKKGSALVAEKTDMAKPAFATQNGKRIKATLPDGTTVWLNAGSRLFYETDFNGATREVKLEGEAFFDVVKKAKQPFIVHVNDVAIKVLGTAFNVRAYAEDNNVETTLYRGLVNVSKDGDKTFRPIMLYPNQKLVIPREEGSGSIAGLQVASEVAHELPAMAVKQIDSTITPDKHVETAWMYNRLEFRGDDFETLASKLTHWYDVKIIFEDDAVKQLSFNGSFENERIEQALRALQAATPFSYRINGKEIYIGSR
ncbi:MAG: DUF4974 domain-containing protein [Niabella sp.]